MPKANKIHNLDEVKLIGPLVKRHIAFAVANSFSQCALSNWTTDGLEAKFGPHQYRVRTDGEGVIMATMPDNWRWYAPVSKEIKEAIIDKNDLGTLQTYPYVEVTFKRHHPLNKRRRRYPPSGIIVGPRPSPPRPRYAHLTAHNPKKNSAFNAA